MIAGHSIVSIRAGLNLTSDFGDLSATLDSDVDTCCPFNDLQARLMIKSAHVEGLCLSQHLT